MGASTATPASSTRLAEPLAWARAAPAGWMSIVHQGRWRFDPHLALVQRYLMALWTGEIRNLILSMPPRHGKSMFVTQGLPGWWLGNDPTDEAIITSYEATLAQTFSATVRDQMAEFGPEVFGLSVKFDKRAAGDWRLENAPGHDRVVTGGMRATGVGGGITGRGGGLIIVDDPFKDARQAWSEVYRNHVWAWYLSTLFTRRAPQARQVVVMTRWHEDDLVGRLVERAHEQEGQEWVVVNLPALAEEDDIMGRELGEPLWPEQWSRDALEEIRGTQTPYWWSSLYQGRPSPERGNIFLRDWWRFWQPPGADLPPVRITASDQPVHAEPLPGLEEVVTSWDLTFGKGEAAAYVSGQKWGRSKANVYLLDEDRDRRNFPETVTAFRSFVDEHVDATGHLVENKANGPALIATLRGEIPGIVPVEPEGTKEERARAESYWMESGNVYLPHPAIAPWVLDYIEEFTAFPNGRYNDRVDAATQALQRLMRRQKRPGLLWGRRGAKRL